MNCSLCSEFQKKSAWATIGCKTVRLDKVKEHEEGSEHLNSVVLKLEREQAKQFNDNMDKDSHKAITDALKVLFFMVKHNLPLDILLSLVDLIIDVGSENFNKLNLAKNAKYTSLEIVAELLDLLSNEVRDQVFAEIRQSPTFSIMVDEVMDVVSHKHLAICARYISPDSSIKNAFISDPRLDDGLAETITKTIKSELNDCNLNIEDMSSFASDGASVLSGKKSGVWARLKEDNHSLITNHCKDHRLALACRDTYKSIKTMKKLDDMLDNLHKYYKYS